MEIFSQTGNNAYSVKRIKNTINNVSNVNVLKGISKINLPVILFHPVGINKFLIKMSALESLHWNNLVSISMVFLTKKQRSVSVLMVNLKEHLLQIENVYPNASKDAKYIM